jgi:hypothetical protein
MKDMAEGKTDAEDGANVGDGETLLLTQEAVDKVVAERVARERSKFGDYKELKVKAETADTLQAELEKTRVELDKAKASIASAELATKRYALALDNGFNAAQAALLTAPDDAGLEMQVDAIKQLVGGSGQMIVSAEGKAPGGAKTTGADFIAGLMNDM